MVLRLLNILLTVKDGNVSLSKDLMHALLTTIQRIHPEKEEDLYYLRQETDALRMKIEQGEEARTLDRLLEQLYEITYRLSSGVENKQEERRGRIISDV